MMRTYLLRIVLLFSVVLNFYFIWSYYQTTSRGTELIEYNTNGVLLSIHSAQEELRTCKQQQWMQSCSMKDVSNFLNDAEQYAREVVNVAPLSGRDMKRTVLSSGLSELWPEFREQSNVVDSLADRIEQGKSINTEVLDKLLLRMEEAKFPAQIQDSDWVQVSMAVERYLGTTK